MTPVFPYLVRRSDDGWRGELLLRLKDGRSVYMVHLPIKQARVLAVEMRGLSSDHCAQHHLALRMTGALVASVSRVIIRSTGHADEVLGAMCLITDKGLQDVTVDAAAALAMAVHVALPIFMDGEFSQADSPLRASRWHDDAPAVTPIPKAFRDVVEGPEFPGGDGEQSA